jgi:transcriptional regulator with XRE-family HTH domain
MSIAKNIKKRRLELGLTLKQVADSLGVAESTISRYESNEIRNMGIDKIETLAQTLKTSPSYLLGWTEADPFYQADIDDLNSVFEDYGLRIDLVDPDDPDWAVFYWNGSKYEFTRIPLDPEVRGSNPLSATIYETPVALGLQGFCFLKESHA